MKLTIMKRVRKIMVVAIGNDVTMIRYESVAIYQRILMDNVAVERLALRERLVVA